MPVMTTKGPVPQEDLGVTLSHEHILINIENQAVGCSGPESNDLSWRKVEAEHFPILLKNPYLMADNLNLDSVEDAISEVNEFKKAGGGTIVDCTPLSIGRDPEKLSRVASATGVNIVMGCGYYTQDTHPGGLRDWPCEKIRDEMLGDLLEGIGGSRIKAGIIGEIGTSKNIHPDEFKVMKASAMASVETGAAIQVHIYPWGETGIDVVDFLLKNKVAPKKIVVCHADVVLEENYIRSIIERGVFLQFDNFGKEFAPNISPDSFAGGRFARDIERARFVRILLDKGFENQILLTTDICLKCLLKKYGGKGYSHILENIVDMLLLEGVPRETTRDVLLTKNPAIMLDK